MLTRWLREVLSEMRLLLFETSAYCPSSPLFLEALVRLAADCEQFLQYEFVDEAAFVRPRGTIISRLFNRAIGKPPIDAIRLNQVMLERGRTFKPDVVLIGKGAFISPETLAAIKADTGAVLVNYATDDPFNRNVNTPELVESIGLYDIYACTKRAIMNDVSRAGCPRVIYVPFGYKPELHFPELGASDEERGRFKSDVAFIGGCDSDRAPLFAALALAMPELDLALYGGFWNRWPALRGYWRGFAIGRDFRLALGGTKIAINVVRKANRDDHVMRTFEIPACGAFMLTERTREHLELFGEGDSAAYFASPEELASQIEYYLAHDQEREAIARRGRAKVTSEAHSYMDRVLSLLGAVGSLNAHCEKRIA